MTLDEKAIEWFGENLVRPSPLQSVVWAGPVLNTMMVYHYDTIKVILGSKGTVIGCCISYIQ